MKTFFSVVVLAGVLGGCAHGGHKRGSVVFTDSPKEGHVCLGENEVKVGDPVRFYAVSCSSTEKRLSRNGLSSGMVCVKNPIGNGKVIGITDEHFSRVEFDGNGAIASGMVVEKD